MRRARDLVLLAGLAFTLSCRIEDHTPTGSRRDDAAIRALLVGYYSCLSDGVLSACRDRFWPGAVAGTLALRDSASGVEAVPMDSVLERTTRWLERLSPGFSVEMTRLELRQAGDLASAWVSVRLLLPKAGGKAEEQEGVEQFVLRRIGTEWRIAYGTIDLPLAPEPANH